MKTKQGSRTFKYERDVTMTDKYGEYAGILTVEEHRTLVGSTKRVKHGKILGGHNSPDTVLNCGEWNREYRARKTDFGYHFCSKPKRVRNLDSDIVSGIWDPAPADRRRCVRCNLTWDAAFTTHSC